MCIGLLLPNPTKFINVLLGVFSGFYALLNLLLTLSFYLASGNLVGKHRSFHSGLLREKQLRTNFYFFTRTLNYKKNTEKKGFQNVSILLLSLKK